MSSIAHCPRCDERVRIPDVDGPAEVRCPWCGAEFELDEIVSGLPPMLEVLSVVGGHYQAAGVTGLADVSDSLEYQLDYSLQDSQQSPATAFNPVTNATDFSATERMSPAVKARPRTRRRRESPIISFLKMAGGGVAGIFIALLILQAIGKVPDLGFWPFNGPNTKLIPSEWFAEQAETFNGSSGDTDGSSPEQTDTRPTRSNSQPIDLGVPDFAQVPETQDSGLQDLDATGSETSEPVSTPSADSSPNADSELQSLTEILNDYIRSNGKNTDAADKIRKGLASFSSELANADVKSTELTLQLDVIVDRLKYENQILKALVTETTNTIKELNADGVDIASDLPTSLALIGQIKMSEDRFILQSSPNTTLMLKNTEPFADVFKDAVVLVIGDIESGSSQATLKVHYAKVLKKS